MASQRTSLEARHEQDKHTTTTGTAHLYTSIIRSSTSKSRIQNPRMSSGLVYRVETSDSYLPQPPSTQCVKAVSHAGSLAMGSRSRCNYDGSALTPVFILRCETIFELLRHLTHSLRLEKLSPLDPTSSFPPPLPSSSPPPIMSINYVAYARPISQTSSGELARLIRAASAPHPTSSVGYALVESVSEPGISVAYVEHARSFSQEISGELARLVAATSTSSTHFALGLPTSEAVAYTSRVRSASQTHSEETSASPPTSSGDLGVTQTVSETSLYLGNTRSALHKSSGGSCLVAATHPTSPGGLGITQTVSEPALNAAYFPSVSAMPSQTKARLVAHKSDMKSLLRSSFTSVVNKELESRSDLSEQERTDISERVLDDAELEEVVQEAREKVEKVVKEFVALASKSSNVKIRSFSKVNQGDMTMLLSGDICRKDVFCLVERTDIFKLEDAITRIYHEQSDIRRPDVGRRFITHWKNESGRLLQSLKVLDEFYGHHKEARSRTSVDIYLFYLKTFFSQLTEPLFAFPELEIASQSRGSVQLKGGKGSLLVTGSVDVMVVAASPGGSKPPAEQVAPLLSAPVLDEVSKKVNDLPDYLPKPLIHFIPIEVKRLGEDLIKKHLAQAFFEAAASLRVIQAQDQK
ncbi:hypothetical protein BKA70DRAFT_1316682 [Coprinopsis sp. MPI-PUGE-AT-0042]|nr:hypothetical protein BKA70DRAFT_1316682 [Coprinopsis sp. MPI-PUGE-AT-0042]